MLNRTSVEGIGLSLIPTPARTAIVGDALELHDLTGFDGHGVDALRFAAWHGLSPTVL